VLYIIANKKLKEYLL